MLSLNESLSLPILTASTEVRTWDSRGIDHVLTMPAILPWVDEIRYLGVFIVRNRRFKYSLVNSKRSFYHSVNAILGKVLSTATINVILHLINSKCVPVLLYGLEVCPLNKADIQSLDFCVNRLLMKLFCTNNLSVIAECRHYFNIALPSELLCMRAEKFLLKLNANCG